MNQVNQVNQVNQSSYTSSYRSEIDGLRAFAVLSVVAFHAFPSWLKGGFIGVDVFFVISGFLITSHIFEKLDKGQFSFTDFFGRRIRRIFPALILVMSCSLAFGWFALLADEFAQLGKHVASGAAFITNFILVDESGYFDNAAETKPMLHLWSLAVEEQFYIVWPLVLWLAWKRKFNLLTITILVAVVSFYLNLRFVKSHPTETFFWPVGRFWELLSGSVLAWLLLYKSALLSRFKLWVDKFLVRIIHSKEVQADGATTSNLMSFFGLLLLAYGVVRINESLSFPSKWALIPVLGAVLIIASGSKAWLNRIFLMNPIAVWFGLISYPLYLWHWPILSFLQIVEGEMAHRDARIIAVLLSILLAWLTYRLLEVPIRRVGNWGLKTVALSASLTLIGLFAFAVHKTEGRILPLTPKQVVADTAKASPKRKDCHFPLKNDFSERSVCEYFHTKKLVAVFGNSHSVELAFGLAQVLKDVGYGVRHHTMSGCVHNFGSTKDKNEQQICAAWQSEVVKELVSDDSISSVIVSFRNEEDINNVSRRKSLVEMLRKLVEANKDVVLVLQAPMPSKHINSYIRKEVFGVKSSVKGRTKEDWFNMYSAKNDLLRELPQAVKVYDPSDVFCDLRDCYVVKEGSALFFDGDHMSVKGAELVAKELVPLLKLN
ncbi:acyltransferase family protein [Vibrio cholerae]|uniref:acyltransferase family protein n=1 Tax=Vibrio cholerae TaxID=666 RepID=UPI0019D1F9FE|nr:acyltransferase family protein [Vibrio cholerae]